MAVVIVAVIMVVIVATVVAVRVIAPRVLAILRMIVAVAPMGAGLSGGHYAAIQHSSV